MDDMHQITNDHMHGSSFIFLKRFVKHNNNYSTWLTRNCMAFGMQIHLPRKADN